mmetsp:Transcript_106801/g.212094  ORF Transcript_106801/g.212094 Transcript_106801/m.212094 type:complete len:490 (+) Transcript_106801:50-1519(+)
MLWALLPALLLGTATAGSWQRHLSYGQTFETMMVMWVTPEKVDKPLCAFGPTQALGASVVASSEKIWQIGGISEVSHACELSPLVPGQRYYYKVGYKSPAPRWSDTASFVARPNVTDWTPTIIVFGDLGVENGVSLARLEAEAASGTNDFILHVGDIAYDLRDDGGKVSRAFMENIEPVASMLPYMTCIGNHEGGTDFDHVSSLYHYMHRFWMPGHGDLVRGSKGNSVYYSFDAGPAHIVAFSSEVYFWQQWDLEQQFAFLERDLAAVDRKRTPWVITMAHRPMYCSNADNDDCTKEASNMRTGFPLLGRRLFPLEELFYKYGVDLAFWAHEHSYERLWPVFNNRVMNGTGGAYVNPAAPVHIVAGAAGCREHHDAFKGQTANWSAFRSEEYGFGKLQLLNATHLRWRQFDASGGSLVDEMLLVKTQRPRLTPRQVQHWNPRDLSADEILKERDSRETIYAQTQGCTARGAVPQEGCHGKAGWLAEHVV